MNFTVHEKLQHDCFEIGSTRLCRVLRLNAQQIPWLILVPMIHGLTELYEMSESDRNQLVKEATEIGKCLMLKHKGDKFNLAALGNEVPQLHVHIIVRHREDAAWPKPVWGNFDMAKISSPESEVEYYRNLLAKWLL